MSTDGHAIYEDIREDSSPSEERASEAASAVEVLTRIELDIAYTSEKVLNLDMLRMHVASKVSDHESLARENGSTAVVEKAFEFDILSGILESEARELHCFMNQLEQEILDTRSKASSGGELPEEIEEKLHGAEESLKQSQVQVSDIITQLQMFGGASSFGNGSSTEYLARSHHSSFDAKWETQTVEQQRHTLQMLEKSLAAELDLEKKLSDARQNEEAMNLRLHYAEQEVCYMEETVITISQRLFEAENAAQVLEGTSKELVGKLHVLQFGLNSATHRETDMRHTLEESVLKLSDAKTTIQKLEEANKKLTALEQQNRDLRSSVEVAEDECSIAKSEALVLKDRLTSLEEQLRESNTQLQKSKMSIGQQTTLNTELRDMENSIIDLREGIYEADTRAETAEAKCKLLAENNSELNVELLKFRVHETERTNLLEIKLKETDACLEQARASVEASEEQQAMLYSTLSDMENVIEEMKTKCLQAEKRAESAESKCNLLSDTNLELNEELGFLRSKLQRLEGTFHEKNAAKKATAKDIGVKTKVISDLVMKLALERERLQKQISSLRNENEILVKKWKTENNNGNVDGNGSRKEFEFPESQAADAITKFSTSNFVVHSSLATTTACKAAPDIAVEDDIVVESKSVDVRSIEAGQLKVKHVVVAVVVLLTAVVGMYISQT